MSLTALTIATVVAIELLAVAVTWAAIRTLLGIVWPIVVWLATKREQRLLGVGNFLRTDRVTPLGFTAVVVAALCLTLMPYVTFSTSDDGILAIAGVAFFVCAWLVHIAHGHSRTIKYIILLTGMAGITRVPSLWHVKNAQDYAPSPLIAHSWTLLAMLGIAGSAIYAILRLRLFSSATTHSLLSTRTLYHRLMWLQGADALSLIVWVAMCQIGLSGPYLILRYCVKAIMSQRPVVYLRPFSEDAAWTFSELIMPALGRKAVVSGLVHVAQTASSLQQEIPLLWRSQFASVSNEVWQLWIEEALRTCQAAVVDARSASDSVEWELQRAKNILDDGRLLVLRSNAIPHEEIAQRVALWGSKIFELDADRPSKLASKQARQLDPRRGRLTLTRASLIISLILGPFLLSAWGNRSEDRRRRTIDILEEQTRISEIAFEAGSVLRTKYSNACPDDANVLLVNNGIPPARKLDVWGRNYVVQCNAYRLRLISRGADGKLGTADDIVETASIYADDPPMPPPTAPN